MARQPDPERKPQLLNEIIEYLLDKSLSAVTFRNLADHLDVSTFTLVYHFGTKTQLIADLVEAICTRQHDAFDDAEVSTDSIDDYFESFRRYWNWTLEPRNRALQRLEFEAAMIESLDRGRTSATRASLTGWHDLATNGMRALGVPERRLEAEARAMVNTVYGLQYDLIVLGELDGVQEAFEIALDAYRSRLHQLVP